MKRILSVFLLILFLTGCSGRRDELDRAMALRTRLLGCGEVTFDAKVTADYGQELYQFAMHCTGECTGNLNFIVTAPETINGIAGQFVGEQGLLTFDDFALEFPRLTDDQITPVSGPWILLKTLMGGYLTSCGADGEYLRLTVNDSYEDDALTMDIWLDGDNRPVRGEILYDGRRIVTMDIENFRIS